MDPIERDFMSRAIEEARRSVPEDGLAHPKVGVVVVKDGKIVGASYRGEGGDSHAEYYALEVRLREDVLAGATVYTTWEPCTSRNHPNISCAQSLIERRVARVVIGWLDPDPEIVGRGLKLLQEAGIVTETFPDDLLEVIQDLNREYIRRRGEQARFRGVLRSQRVRGLSRLSQLAHRLWVTWSGEKPDFLVDGVRFIALMVLAWGIIETLGFHPVQRGFAQLGIIFPLFDYRYLLVPAALIVYFHIFVYTFIRKPKKWDIEYRNRNLALAAAHDAITASIRKEINTNRLRSVERNALSAIKSYVEFTVSDRDGNNFCASLIVKHPHLDERPVCIRQTDAARRGVTIADADMARVHRTIETSETFYDGDFRMDRKHYRMVWLLPVRSTHSKDPRCIGVVSIDSRKPQHLDLVDDRHSLLLNLSPYLSLLELALAARFEYNIWDGVE